ncbi:MAG TPA: FKBP-type peptidyl-prolyl cis-trans isomerase [Opitutaceae bacterium]|jgi:FKBP-type peptidyl-prolyl cis-trans isomerase|nr:FKBP-type peptidyl-prolyl cis-trans isomerase [Opitutaceae bacterium]
MPSAPLRSFFYLLLLGVVLLTIAIVVRSGMLARKNPGEPITAAMRAALASEQKPELSQPDELFIEEHYPTARILPSGVRYILLAQGTGDARPLAGQEAAIRYEVSLLDGTPIDSSDAHGGEPFTFRVSHGQVIKGLDEVAPDMRKGEKRRLIIPWWLAYGETGSPPKIPPSSTLVFDVELVDFH